LPGFSFHGGLSWAPRFLPDFSTSARPYQQSHAPVEN
jgi:hypothetical protein